MRKRKQTKKQISPKGIGGWIILPIIGLFVSIFLLLLDISASLEYLSASLVQAAILLDVILLGLVVYSLILIFKKSKSAPKIFIIFLWVNFAVAFFTWAIVQDEDSPVNLFRVAIASLIWTAYFKKSKRVKNTFVK